MFNLKNVRDLGLSKGVLVEAKKGVDNLLKLFKRFLKVLNVPFYDECCPVEDQLLPVGFTETDGIVRYNPDTKLFETIGGGGLAGTNYIYVMADGTDVENAAELSAAYTTAQSMSPSATNRITIVCGPGNYNFSSTTFTMNTQYIDLVSLDSNRSIIFNSANAAGTISITANDVFVKGVNVGTKKFTIAANLNLLKVENCIGGNDSFSAGLGQTTSGTFINSVGGNDSFGSNGATNGTFTNCTAGDESFGYGGTASGTFTNCQGGVYSFGGSGGGTASGTFTSCVGGNFSFGGGGGAVLTGKLFYCRLTAGSFQTVSGAGITRLCLDGSNVENNQG